MTLFSKSVGCASNSKRSRTRDSTRVGEGGGVGARGVCARGAGGTPETLFPPFRRSWASKPLHWASNAQQTQKRHAESARFRVIWIAWACLMPSESLQSLGGLYAL